MIGLRQFTPWVKVNKFPNEGKVDGNETAICFSCFPDWYFPR